MAGKESFRDQVKKRIKGLGLTLKGFAQEVKIPTSTLTNWLESGFIPLTKREIIARGLNLSVEELVSLGISDGKILGRPAKPELRFNEADLQKLIEAQKVLGDLSVPLMVQIIEDSRTRS